jgi:D-inositol-3-phosphate glycosyltransferase
VSALNLAMISVHSSPMGPLGTRDTGGMSVYIRELACQLGQRGHRVDIFTRPLAGEGAGSVRHLGVNVRLVALDCGLAADLPKEALVHFLPAFFRAMDLFRQREAIPYALIHSHYWLSGLVGHWARRAWEIPHLTTFHTLGMMKELVCGKGSEPPARLLTERRLAESGNRILVTSRREKENLLRFYPAAARSITVVPCGVDLDRFRPLERSAARRLVGAALDERLVLFVGRFAREKGLERLLSAVSRLQHVPRLRLMVVGGDGNGQADFERIAAQCQGAGLDGRVRMVGHVDQSALPAYYAAADILVLPSAYESFGLVALEALACGTPVMATRVGAMEDLLAPAGNGWLLPEGSPDSLAAAIETVLRHGGPQRASAKALRRSISRFGWSRVAEAVCGVYGAILKEETKQRGSTCGYGGVPESREASVPNCSGWVPRFDTGG